MNQACLQPKILSENTMVHNGSSSVVTHTLFAKLSLNKLATSILLNLFFAMLTLGTVGNVDAQDVSGLKF